MSCQKDDTTLDEWWRKFQQHAEGVEPTGVPAALVERGDLQEILAEPLLNFLLAQALRRGIDPATVSLNTLYRGFIGNVYERVWEGEGSPRHTQGILQTEAQFLKVLSEIGVAIWHGGGISAKTAAITTRCEEAGIVPAWTAVTKRCSENMGQLLMSFYLRFPGAKEFDAESVEFTHKSFGEYLTALRIVEELERVARERDTKKALIYWIQLFGQQSMWNESAQIFRFVEAEIAARHAVSPEQVSGWQKRLAGLAEQVVADGMPVDEVYPKEQRLSYRKEQEQARNAEEALLAVLGACWCATHKFHRISRWSKNGLRGQAWLNRLRGDLMPWQWAALRPCLQGLISLGADLLEAYLSYANLRGADLSRAFLSRADLRGADLRGAFSWSAKNKERRTLSELAREEPKALPRGLSNEVIARLKVGLNPE